MGNLALWRLFGRPTILLMLPLVIWADPDCGLLPDSDEEERLLKERAVRRIQQYDAVVEYFYLNFMSYQQHLYKGLLLLCVNLVVQGVLALLEMLGGLHSWWLLGSNLKGGFFQVQRPAYRPAENDAPSVRMVKLAGDFLTPSLAGQSPQ